MTRLARVLRAAALVAVAAVVPGCVDVVIGPLAEILSYLSFDGEVETFRFTSADGATLTIEVSALDAAEADFEVTLAGPGGPIDLSGAAESTDVPGRRIVRGLPLAAPGDHVLGVGADRPVAYRMSFRLGAAKGKPVRLDLRPERFGRPRGDVTWFGRRLGTGGGSVIVDAAADGLSGAEVVVPAGALRRETDVFLATGLSPRLEDLAHRRTLGQALRLGPDRAKFRMPVAVALPVRTFEVAGPVDLLADVRILVVERGRRPREIAPLAATETDGGALVRFETTRGGTFVPVIARRTPSLARRVYFEVGIGLELVPEASGDSRTRRLTAIRRHLDFTAGPGAYAESSTVAAATLAHDDDGVDFATTRTEGEAAGTWTLAGNVLTTAPSGAAPPDEWFTSDDGTALVRRNLPGSDPPAARLSVAVQQVSLQSIHAPFQFAGTYAVGGIEVSMDPGPPGPGAVGTLEITRLAGLLEIELGAADPTVVVPGAAAGRWSASLAATTLRGDGADPAGVGTRAKRRLSGTFMLVAEGDFAGVLELVEDGPDPPPPLRVHPSDDGLRLVALRDFGPASSTALAQMLVGTRRASSLRRSHLDGPYGAAQFGAALATYDVGGASARTVPDFVVRRAHRTFVFDGRSGLSTQGLVQETLRRDANAANGLAIEPASTDSMFRSGLAKSGKLELIGGDAGPLAGAVDPDAGFGFVVGGSGDPDDPFGLHAFVRLAPGN